MASTLPVNRQSVIGGIIFLFFLWTLLTFIQSTSPTPSTHIKQKQGDQQSHLDGKPTDAPNYDSPDKSTPVQRPEISLPPWYQGEEDIKADNATPTSAQDAQYTTSADTSNTKNDGRPAIEPTTSQQSPSPPTPKDYGKPLILYAFAESEVTRENLKLFINQGLHDAADFVFILNGQTNVDAIIPQKQNIRVINRPNTCFDIGAYGEVLRKDDLYKKYKRFITLNASIRIELLLNPPPGSSVEDQFGTKNDAVGMGGCYDGWTQAVHAEVGATSIILKQGYKVDLMMTAFHKSKNYIEECDTSQNGDVLRNGRYFGTNVHPYETIFIKANRDIDPTLIQHLTTWQQASSFNSYSVCQTGS
ncbi:hypothetical protein LZ31DRAFT_580942 [Colletotrichum somersetense]|nr:hypothetical protein LZ31DRAFT_580942 [Colletotrichum somersetense]